MSMNDKNADQSESGCYPWGDMEAAHDELRSGDMPEKPTTTTTEKLMKPSEGYNKDDEF